MAYKETDFQMEFGRWIVREENRKRFGTSNFELKCTKKKSINPKNDFEPHQLPELWHSKHKYVYHKHSDQSMVKKPYDCSLWVGVAAYVVIMFYVPRAPKEFYVIDIDDFLSLAESVGKPYIKEEEIAGIGDKFLLTK